MGETNLQKDVILTDANRWIAAVRNGDVSLVDKLYLLHREEFIQWGLKNYQVQREVLIDVYQNAIIALYENIIDRKVEKLKSNLKTYLFGIAKNLLYQQFRKSKTENQHTERLSEHWQHQAEANEDETVYLQKRAKEEMYQMPEPCRSILEHFYFHNYSLEVIAEKMNYRSKDVVKTQKSRCVQTLKEKLRKFKQAYG